MKNILSVLLFALVCLCGSSCNPAHGTRQTLVADEQSVRSDTAPVGSREADRSNKGTAPSRLVDPWPATPPRIGNLVLKQEYWHYMKEAARKYQISPYLIQAVAAIESRYDPLATSGRGQCIGLMQLHRATAKKYGVNPHNPRENIMGGAAVLANLLARYDGDLLRVLRVYNAKSTRAYEREVLKAYQQARQNGATTGQTARSR